MTFKLIALIVMTIFTVKTSAWYHYYGGGCSCICSTAQTSCPLIEDVVYAVEDNKCQLYRNQCFFELEQSRRRQSSQPELQQTNVMECNANCEIACTKELAPVCAEYCGGYRTFSNECEMRSVSCLENKSYVLQYSGPCQLYR